MNLKQTNKFLQDSIKKYQKEEVTDTIGLAIKKNFKEFLDVLDYGDSNFMEDENAVVGATNNAYKKADYIHSEVLSYLKKYSIPSKKSFHPWLQDISISDGDHFSYYYLFVPIPTFEPCPKTILNAVNLDIFLKDYFLVETLGKINEFTDYLDTFLDNITIDSIWLSDLQDKLQ